VKQIELSDRKHLTLAVVREALRNGDELVLCDDGEPLVKLMSVAAEQKARKDFFTYYPHDPAECFNSCWRHNGSAEAEAQGLVEMAKDEVAAEPVAVG
jgi:antitoxin (DNA-binding transcriptional repressor) of toxin-antitoxin stability system